MRAAFHLWGSRIDEFAGLVSAPHARFYPPTPAPTVAAGVRLPAGVTPPLWAEAVQYEDNRTLLPDGLKYVVFYGDVRLIRGNGRIPVVCDIMDESFWYYQHVLRRFGLFTFSVNTTLCDPTVFEKIVETIAHGSKVVPYEALA